MVMHSIAGEWRGHYQYRHSPDQGCGFNAFFSDSSSRVEGTIVDDFSPGKASLSGSFSFPSLQFTKVYVNPVHKAHIEEPGNKTSMTIFTFTSPIEYEGTMTEDGKTISGTWTIRDDIVK